MKYNAHRWRTEHYEDDVEKFRPFENIDELKKMLEDNGYSGSYKEDKKYEFCHRCESDDPHIHPVSTEGPKDWLCISTEHACCSTRKKKREIYSVYVEWAKDSNMYWVQTFWQSNRDETQTEPCCNKYYNCSGILGLQECLSDLKIIK